MKNQNHRKCLGIRFSLWLASLLLAFPLTAQQQIGRPLITNYKYQDYGENPINWWVLEDEDGIMYFANTNGVLQYDGVSWNKIESLRGARCLTKDDNGTIYMGSNGEIGYLKPNAIGEIEYISLVDKIPEEHRGFSDVWEVDYYQGRIIFRTEFKLYSWDGESIEVLESEDGYHVGAIVHDVYYLRIWGRGLCYLTDEDTFELVPGGERFANERIYVILPYDEDQVLIGTRNEGFFLYDGKEFKPFDTEVDAYTQGD